MSITTGQDNKGNSANTATDITKPRKKVIVAVHGIGDQFSYATVQSAAYQFCNYYEVPAAIPLGRFHSHLQKIQENGAFFWGTPPDPPVKDLGFAEVYWAGIPREQVKLGYILEESKRWARTVVERFRAHAKEADMEMPKETYSLINTVLEEMIETIAILQRLTFLAEKAGIFKFDLNGLLVSYLGDVQLVTEFAVFRGDILAEFNKVMQAIMVKNGDADIYIIAHSEGTVVSFKGLLNAMCDKSNTMRDEPPEVSIQVKDVEGCMTIGSPTDKQSEKNDVKFKGLLNTQSVKPPDDYNWIKNVRGFMTIGSPIDKHIILWPELWEDVKTPDPDLKKEMSKNKIPWRNYYDFGDPVGFDLETARGWMRENKWEHFEFESGKQHDIGFSRYLFPGKAHVDYWQDEEVFNHFIQTVVERDAPPPSSQEEIEKQRVKAERATDFANHPTKWLSRIVSNTVPYLLIFAILLLAVFFIYKASVGLTEGDPDARVTAGNILGLATLLYGVTVVSRVPRLTNVMKWRLIAIGLFILSMALYVLFNCWLITEAEDSPGYDFFANKLSLGNFFGRFGALYIAVLVAILVRVINKIWPERKFQMWPLLLLGVAGTIALLWIHFPEGGTRDKPIWPLFLALAGFLYLWWLAALMFDLVFAWQRYIRYAQIMKYLNDIKDGKKSKAIKEKQEKHKGTTKDVVPAT
jgi:hypothetical protein